MSYQIIFRNGVAQGFSRENGLLRPLRPGETVTTFEGDRPPGLVKFRTRLNSDGTLSTPDRAVVSPLRGAVARTLEQLAGWNTSLQAVSNNFPAEDVATGLDFLMYAGRGLRLVVLSSNWTRQEKMAFCRALGQGAADVTTPQGFFSVIEQDGSFVRPTGPVVWASPDTGQRWPLAEAITRTANIAANFAPAPNRPSAYTNYSWVNRITE